MKVTKKKVTTVTETTTYHLHPNVVLREVVVNGEQQIRDLQKFGTKKRKSSSGYTLDFWPIYNPDLTYLEETNPFWYHNKTKDQEWFKGSPLPENPEDIDVSKIVFMCSSDNSFWTVDIKPIPVVVFGDYIGAGIRSTNFDLVKLHKYFSNHKQVKEISDIQLIPYYNNDSGCETYFEVKVLPTVKQLNELGRKDELFYVPWNKKDYLGMKKFWINKNDY